MRTRLQFSLKGGGGMLFSTPGSLYGVASQLSTSLVRIQSQKIFNYCTCLISYSG